MQIHSQWHSLQHIGPLGISKNNAGRTLAIPLAWKVKRNLFLNKNKSKPTTTTPSPGTYYIGFLCIDQNTDFKKNRKSCVSQMRNCTASLWLDCFQEAGKGPHQIEVLPTSALFLLDLETLEGKVNFVSEMTFNKANSEVCLVLFAFSRSLFGASILQLLVAGCHSSEASPSSPNIPTS